MSDLFTERRRSPLFLLTGLVIGLIFGLIYSWKINPLDVIDTAPVSLSEEDKDSYRAMIALAYMADGDVNRAFARLLLLKDDDPTRTMTLQAQQILADGGSVDEARALGLLAEALGASIGDLLTQEPPGSPMPTAENGDATPSPEVTKGEGEVSIVEPSQTTSPSITPHILPTRTPTITPGAPYALQEYIPVCDPTVKKPLIRVFVYNASRQPVPGTQVVVSWEGGENRFFTGLKPEYGLGYADFEMQPGVVYAVKLVEGGETVSNLYAPDCEGVDGGERFWGSWQVEFVQPAVFPTDTPELASEAIPITEITPTVESEE